MAPTAVRLFCLPYSGASAMVYARWRQALPPWLSVSPLELPGRGARRQEPLATDPHRLASDLAGDLARELVRDIDGDYALFGHSLGALLAFEIAHALLERGVRAPRALFAAGSEAPAVRDDSDMRRARTDAELIAELRDLEGTPREVLDDEEMMRLVLPVLRADFLLCGHYAYRRRSVLPCPIHVLGGREDAVGEEALRAWAEETSGGFSLQFFDGSHFFIHGRQAAVLDAIERHLSPGVRFNWVGGDAAVFSGPSV
ncbi:MAG: alpha/beta fold hydrolase [Kiloniellaceae bacterium]